MPGGTLAEAWLAHQPTPHLLGNTQCLVSLPSWICQWPRGTWYLSKCLALLVLGAPPPPSNLVELVLPWYRVLCLPRHLALPLCLVLVSG